MDTNKSTTQVVAHWWQLYYQAKIRSTATANTRVKFPSRTGTRLHKYTGYGKNTHAKSLIHFHKQLITISHNKTYQYLTEIPENKQGFQFARIDSPAKCLDITPIHKVTTDKLQPTRDTKFG